MSRLFHVIAILALTTASTQGAQNLIPNGTFDTNTAGWTVDSNNTLPSAFSWNATGAPPGSAQITNSLAGANLSNYVYTQCIAVNPSASLNFSGDMRRPSGQSTAGNGFLFVYWYLEPTCNTPSPTLFGQGPAPTTSEVDVWRTYAVNPLKVPSDTHGALVGIIVNKVTAGGTHTILFDNLSLIDISPATAADIVASAFPSPLFTTAGDPTAATTSYTLTNRGQTSTTITLSQGGDQNGGFFTQSPSSFTLAPEASQTVTISSVAQAGAAALNGFSAVSGSGVPANFRVPVQLLSSASAPSTTTVVAVTSRVDVAAPFATNPTGTITYRNDSNATGILSSDVAWIIPQAGAINLQAGQSTNVSFQIDRSKQPDASSNPAGSLTGRITLVYPKGSAGAKSPLDSPSLATSLVVPVTDTRQPTTKSDSIPQLAAGEVALLIPGIGHVTGSGGKEFISDVSILNSQSVVAVADAKLYYSAPAATVSTPQPVSGGQAIQLADVVNTYFAQGTSSQGTLHIRAGDTSKLAVSANVFNKANPKGTYGTAIPVFRSNKAASSGETLYLTGLRKDANAHTNLYLQEVSGSPASAHIEFFDANGASLGERESLQLRRRRLGGPAKGGSGHRHQHLGWQAAGLRHSGR